MFLTVLIEYMADDIGIGLFQFGVFQWSGLSGHSRGKGTIQARKNKYIFLHFRLFFRK